MKKKDNFQNQIYFVNKTFEGIAVPQLFTLNNDFQAQQKQQIFYKQQDNNIVKPLNQISQKLIQQQSEERQDSNILSYSIKSLVSKNKRRFEWRGFNLDLSYITDKIIAMGFPSQNIESIYRNDMDDVEKFLEKRHKTNFRVYNLCQEKERKYQKTRFHGNIVQFPFQDHMPPQFQMIYSFCHDAKSWIQKDQSNVIVVHCKAGKGRTGTMICCLLMYLKLMNTAEQALMFYGQKRTVDLKGVTIPSQIRYIRYFQQALKGQIYLQKYLSLKRLVKINKIRVLPLPQLHIMGGCTPWVQILNKSNSFKSKYSHSLITFQQSDYFELQIDHSFYIQGDMIIRFYNKKKIGGSQLYMHICLNSNFIDETVRISGRKQIDGVKNDNRFNVNTMVEISFLIKDE